ncbi:MAG TPA: sugar-binding protein [Tepidisphaeraceae bacterium]|nr:sugar-binding protein [Tepidisphaeraceae bacterium]
MFRNPTAFFTALLLAGALPFAPGCKRTTAGTGGPTSAARTRHVFLAPPGQPLKLAFVSNNASDFWKQAEAGVDAYSKESGVQVVFKKPNSTNLLAEQNGILEDLLTQGYNGIAISPWSPAEQTRELNRAAAQTNLICADSDCPKSNRLEYIGTNNYEAGKKLGEQIVKLLPKGGKMAVFVGTFSADNARQRLQGIQDVIAGHNIDIVAKKEDSHDAIKQRANPEDVINNTSLGVNLLCGLWSYNGGEIAAAIRASGKQGQLIEVCFDDDKDTLKAIEEGIISCTVVQKPYLFGYDSAKLLHDLAVKGQSALPANDVMDLGVEVVDAENVKAYQQKIGKMFDAVKPKK